MNRPTSFTIAALLLTSLAGLLCQCQTNPNQQAAEVTTLRCEYLENPLGIDAEKPRFSWVIEERDQGTEARDLKQTAYQVLVASSEELLNKDKGDLWDSGKVASDQSIQLEYKGKPLESRMQCYWKVRIWDQDGKATAWSNPSAWIMGLLSSSDWQAKWIKYSSETKNEAQYLRKEVNLDKPVKRAVVRFACLGFADVLINGRKPDETLMIAPRFANPAYRVIYTTLDVTHLLKQGDNCIGAILGNGYNSPPSKGWNDWQASLGMPQLMLELEVEFADGSIPVMGTDDTWTANLGRIQYNDFWVKEVHDLNEEQEGWALPAFKDPHRLWKPVALAEAPKGRLQALRNPPVRRFESVKALRRDGNKYIFDRVYTGFPRIKVKGKRGDVVSIRGNQELAMREVFGPVVIDFTLRDTNEVILEPRFFVHTIGPEFTITGLDHLPAPEDVSIEVVHADLQSSGDFECSNPLFNELHQIGRHTHFNYILNYPLDPTREKAGWSQDIQNMFESASYMTETTTLYEEWWQDYADVQMEDGRVASVAPTNVGHVETGMIHGGAA